MASIPLAILALAAGVYLLTYVKQFSLGALYKYLSWLVILLSLAFILGGIARGVMHYRHMRQCGMHEHPAMGQKYGECPYMQAPGGANCCTMPGQGMSGMNAACCKDMPMSCCKDMKGMGSCTDMKGGDAKPSCCAKGAAADSTAKK